jgi:2-C-methyl-D-erythritol 4-phosphate cytidylyltransferase
MPAPERVATVIVAGGRGRRAGAADKVLLPLCDRPLLAYALDAAERAATVTEIIVVAGEHILSRVEAMVAGHQWSKIVAVVVGGERRQDSVAAGLAAVPAGVTLVAVHDGARPLVTPDLFDACLAAARLHGGAIAAVPVTDTLKRVVAGRVVETVAREELWAAQTPQAFQLALLRRAVAEAERRGLTATDEAALVEALGRTQRVPLVIVPGSPENLKITRLEDLPLAEALLRRRLTAVDPEGTPDP